MMEVIDIQAVKDCLAEVSDCEDKQYAIALLEWAIGKRTFDLAEHDKQIREDVISEISREMRVLYGNEYEKQVKLDGIREFAMWLLHHSMICDSLGQDLNDDDLLSESEIIDKVLSEWQKEEK